MHHAVILRLLDSSKSHMKEKLAESATKMIAFAIAYDRLVWYY